LTDAAGIHIPCRVPERAAIDALVTFARVVSDADRSAHVLSLLADALHAHVCPDGVAIYALDASGRLSLAAERGVGTAAEIAADEIEQISDRLRAAFGERYATQIVRPLVAGGNLFGAVAMLGTKSMDAGGAPLRLADGLIDLAAIALGTQAHVEQLERQFAALKEQQDMLARTEKLRALGQMAAGISHDLKNILNPLSLHIQVVTRALDKGHVDDAKESAVEMKQVVQRGVQTLERLRDFSRQDKESKTELVELDRLAREAAAIGKSRSGSTAQKRVVRIVEDLHAPPAVMAVSGEILAALVNLVVNAVDAGASTITLRSGEEDGGSWIAVADDGPGMPPDVANRVFEPFFTTKGTEGTGLGLAMVYASMQRHGGKVVLDTDEGKGTTFKLWFTARGSGAHPLR
jgi:signal transduction histidine kinase